MFKREQAGAARWSGKHGVQLPGSGNIKTKPDFHLINRVGTKRGGKEKSEKLEESLGFIKTQGAIRQTRGWSINRG